MEQTPIEPEIYVCKGDASDALRVCYTPEPTLADRLGCACYVLAHGASYPGVWTTRRLMWPHTQYTDANVAVAAAKVLASVGTALLAAAPQSLIDQISTKIKESLIFEVGDEPPDDGSSGESPAPEVPR